MSNTRGNLPLDLGERLRVARSNAGKKQDEAAQKAGISRTTLIAIEQGQRKARPDELHSLASFYDVSVNHLLRNEAIHVDLIPKFRKGAGCNDADSAASESVQLLAKLATSAAEIEARMGQIKPFSYPPEWVILPGNLEQQAEDLALELRHRLGIGLAAVNDIVSLIEIELGIKLFFRPVHSSISGAFIYDKTIGAAMLVNLKHPTERQIMTIIHEMGHFMCSRREANIWSDNTDVSREERFVTLFSSCFLMPAAVLRKRFRSFLGDGGSFTVRHLLLLAHSFGVSFEAMARRLESLELIPKGTFDNLKNRGFSPNKAKQATGIAPIPPISSAPPKSTLLIIEAHRKGILSEGQLSEMLALDRVELRQHLASIGGEEMNDEIAIET